MKLDYRYQAIDYTGKVLATGKLLGDVEAMGERILIDYKLNRYTLQGIYPVNRYNWHQGFNGISYLLKQEVK